MQNYEQTLVSQYANSPKLIQLISDFNDCLDPTADIDAFYANFWDLDTAYGVGLDYWDRIVGGTGRNIAISPVDKYLGFDEGQTAANDYQSFGYGILYSGVKSGAYVLADGPFRTLIYATALGNITNGSVLSYNKLLSLLYPNNTVYLKILGAMSVQVYFQTSPTQFEVSILSAIFPRISPAGVQFTT